MTYRLYQFCTRFGANHRRHFLALVTVFRVDTHFDQFVVIERGIDFE